MGACKLWHESGRGESGAAALDDHEKLHEAMRSVEFEGWTGNVVFDSVTGSRKDDSIAYYIGNVDYAEGGLLEINKAGYWSAASGFVFDCFDCIPIVYPGGGATPPTQKELPPCVPPLTRTTTNSPPARLSPPH
jgi:hypothetical protein